MEKPAPLRIRMTEAKELSIDWSDGKTCLYNMPLLRRNCPCATCGAEKKDKGPFYIPLFAGDMLNIERIAQQGHYAIQIFWKDGHHTGIYDYDYLRSLCPASADTAGESE
jgi:DUF971 family protein